MSPRKTSITVIGALVFLAFAAGGWSWLFGDLPALKVLPEHLNQPSIRIVDRNQRLLYEVIPESGGRHLNVPLASIPLALQQATIATEDHRFYENPGVDVIGIARALLTNLRGGETQSGGSTLTQQVARNLLLAPDERIEHSLRRKLRESLLAWQLSRRFTKDEILALYLNQMYYGRLAYGVEAAAQTFFGKSVSELDLAESALLAGLPQAPAVYDPMIDLQAARQRQTVVLDRMQAEGYITPEQAEAAQREPFAFTAEPYPMQAPHFVNMVRNQVDALIDSDTVRQAGGVIVHTTLDLDFQNSAERAIRHQIQRVQQKEEGLGHNLNSAALVALDPRTGEILAMVGSPDYFDEIHSGAINMALAPRQPGSSIKPLVYASALDPKHPQPWTAATLLLDVKTSFKTHEGLSYTPSNYDGRDHGPVLVRQALASSLNIPAVLTLEHVGLPDLFTLASQLGITTLHDPQQYDLSLALGGGEVRLLELTAAYGAFANGGYAVEPFSILEVTDLQGHTLFKPTFPHQNRVLDERVAWLISDILSDDEARRLGFGANSVLRLDRPAAVKTGTTSNFHDNWTVGYTPDLVTGVWAGNTNYEPMRDISGLTGAAPIWHEFMRSALAGRPEQEFTRPDGLTRVEICALSGMLPTPDCPYRRWEWFINGTEPTQLDTLYHTFWVDPTNGRYQTSPSPTGSSQSQVVLDLPAVAADWAHEQGITLLSEVPNNPVEPGVQSTDQNHVPLQILSPTEGAIFRLASGYSLETQKLRLELISEKNLASITLWVDGIQISASSQPGSQFSAWWGLQVGQHQVWAEGIDTQGQPLRSPPVNFEVK